MPTKTQQPASPFSRLSRLGLGLSPKSQPSSTCSRDTKVDEDDWYIAYNGPYEVPKDLRKRDSWGDVIEEEGTDTFLHDAGRYEGVVRDSGYGDGADYRRGRAHSTTSGLTTSSGTIDPSRKSIRSPQRRMANSKRGPMSSYINLDAAGGVGESPMPPQRSPSFSTATNRTSIASFLFGSSSASSRKFMRSPSMTNLLESQTETRATSPHTPSSSTSLNIARPRHQSFSVISEHIASTNEGDYYDSYYSTLIPTSKKINKSRSRPPRVNSTVIKPSAESETEPTSPTSPASSPITEKVLHPYAYTLLAEPGSRPVSRVPRPSAPPVLPTTFPILRTHHNAKDSMLGDSDHHARPPPQTLQSVNTPTLTHNGSAVVDGSKIASAVPLRASMSVPNLRILQTQQRQSQGPPLLPTGVERWLSAETWCDAMIFPRPRFKINQGHGVMESVSENHNSEKSSGRIVSPPPTPISRLANEVRETGTNGKYMFPKRPEQDGGTAGPSLRVRLSKSRSATDLRLEGTSSPNLSSAHADSNPDPPKAASGSKDKVAIKTKLQKPRPKRLVLDDLALQSVPSLDQVLNEGDQLEERRRQWQAHATNSFGNKQTRTLSRARAKSLNHKDHRKDKSVNKPVGNIDFLAVRTLLGNQGIAPTIAIRAPPSHRTRSETGSSKPDSHTNSHTHSNSITHSNSQKSSQGTSRGQHSRSDSWSQSALKLAKSTASGALCGKQAHSTNSPMDEKAAAIEGAIMATETKVIRLNEQPDLQQEEDFVIVDSKTFINSNGTVLVNTSVSKVISAMELGGTSDVSPAPSGTTGDGIGIALSTPPADDGHTYESLSMPDHPYAQSAPYFYHQNTLFTPGVDSSSPAGPSVYAGPHPSSPKSAAIAPGFDINDVSTRHRLPPQATLQSLPRVLHPYAMGSYPTEPKAYSEPSNANDFKPQYNETSANNNHMVHAYARVSTGNPEVLGLGEAMTPMFEKNNAGCGESAVSQTSHANRNRNSQTWPLRVRRKPVSYTGRDECSTPGYQGSDISTPSLDHSNPPVSQRHPSTSALSNSSGSSVQHSPRPLGNVDDLDRFHDLFYKPEQSNFNATAFAPPEAVRPRDSNDLFPWDVSSSQSVRSGLSNLARKLTEEYEERRSSDGDSRRLMYGQRTDGLEGHRPADIGSDHGFIFSVPSGPRSASPTPMESPLTLHLGSKQIGPEDNIPEDVQSSRTSSILESTSAEDDTFGLPVRFGAVGALATPPPVLHDYRASGHFSLVADEAETQEDIREERRNTGSPKDESQYLSPPSSRLSPPNVRSSYTTEDSRMSGLSDFPSPPEFPLPLQTLTPHSRGKPSHIPDNTSQNPIPGPSSKIKQ